MKINGTEFQVSPLSTKGIGKNDLTHAASTGEKSFVDSLKESVNEVNRLQLESGQAVKELAAGRAGNIHDVMISMEKASVSFRMMVAVRSKVLEAYQEVMRMQV